MLRYFSSAFQLDTLSTKHDHRCMHEHCEHTHVSAGLVSLTLNLKFSTHINNFELTGDLLSSLNSTTYVLFFN